MLAYYCCRCNRRYRVDVSPEAAAFYRTHCPAYTEDNPAPIVCPNCYRGTPIPDLRPGESEPVLTEDDMKG